MLCNKLINENFYNMLYLWTLLFSMYGSKENMLVESAINSVQLFLHVKVAPCDFLVFISNMFSTVLHQHFLAFI